MKRIITGFTFLLFVAFAACTKQSTTVQNEFRFPIESDPPTLDWNKATDHVSIQVLYLLEEGLTKHDPQLNIQPALAEKWDISPDGKTYTFHLRDVKWSDGVQVKAQDFVAGWQRLLEPTTAAEYAYFLFDIENASEFNAGKVKDFSKVGVHALDDKTLQVTLRYPASYFLHIPSFPVCYPQRADILAANPTQYTEPPNLRSTGPYRLSKWEHDSKLFLEPNPYYYGPKPAISKMYFYVVKEDSTAISLYEQGQLDVALRIPSLDLDRVKKWPDYRSVPILRGYYYGFNVEAKPFDNVHVRRAFAHAINRDEIVAALKGGKLASNSWVPKGMFGYESEVGLAFDPKAAKEELAKAGYPDGKGFPAVKVMYDSLEMNKMVAEKMQFAWKSVLGIPQVELATEEWKVYLDTMTHNTPQIFRLGWGADYPDPHNFLDLFTSVSGNNNTHWKNKTYDSLILAGAKSQNSEERLGIYKKAQKLLLEDDAAIIPLFQESIEMVVKPHVQNFVVDALENPRVQDASIKLIP